MPFCGTRCRFVSPDTIRPSIFPTPQKRAVRLAWSTTVIDSGQKQVVTMNLKSGKYALVCFIQDRAGGPPHFNKGMISEATVS